MLEEKDESITHLTAECKKLAQKDMIILQESILILRELYTWNYARSLPSWRG